MSTSPNNSGRIVVSVVGPSNDNNPVLAQLQSAMVLNQAIAQIAALLEATDVARSTPYTAATIRQMRSIDAVTLLSLPPETVGPLLDNLVSAVASLATSLSSRVAVGKSLF